PRTAEEHYQRGVAMMNIGRWDDARESLDKARKAAPKADHIHYALAALDCLTGEADSALANLKVAIQLRAENRYHARNDEDFAIPNILMKKRASKSKALSPGFRVVALGGGTGLSTLLRGLKEHVIRRSDGRATAERPIADLAAIVTVTDDGGSSGRLRRENRILPPGDIRNCMVALSKDEALLGRLFQYRFHAGRGLIGHNFGNLFLAALTHVTGDFIEAIRVTSKVLAIRGRIFPSTLSNVHLVATLENGRVVHGETRISASRNPIRRLRLSPCRVRPLPAAIEAIDHADLILMGPGSLYTS